MTELITLTAGAVTFSDWARIAVTYSAVEAFRVFAATCADDATGAVAFKLLPETQVGITAGADQIFQGFVDYTEPSFDALAHKVEVQGRSAGAGIADHAALHPSREFRGQTILQIAQALAPPGVTFSTDIALAPVSLFRLNPGETVHHALIRLCQVQHLALASRPDGSVSITSGGATVVHPTVLRDYGAEGSAGRILRASATFDATPKHSAFHIHGQRSLGRASLSTIRIAQTASLTKLIRTKEAIHFPNVGVDDGAARIMAQSMRDRHVGASTTATVTLPSWRDDNGLLWQANTLIQVDAPKLQMQRNMLIRQVNLTQDKEGTLAQLTLCDPAALKMGARSSQNDHYATAKVAN